jgi:hypothetical protein
MFVSNQSKLNISLLILLALRLLRGYTIFMRPFRFIIVTQIK